MMFRFNHYREPRGKLWKMQLGFYVAKRIDGSGIDKNAGRGNYPFVWVMGINVALDTFEITLRPFVNRRRWKAYICR